MDPTTFVYIGIFNQILIEYEPKARFLYNMNRLTTWLYEEIIHDQWMKSLGQLKI